MADNPRVAHVTLIIPSSRSGPALANCLRSVAAQAFDLAELSVVVVFNGLPDPPPLDPAAWPFRLVTDSLPAPNICAAKNRALDLAAGQWVILLNDDVVLTPEFVAAHLRAHQQLGQPALVLGAAPFATCPDETLFDRLIAETSMIFFYDRLRPHTWYNFRHAWNLNLSFRRQDAGAVRFDERLAPVNFDDLEWAFRLERERGLRVWYEPAASLVHHHRYTLDGYLQREQHLGRMAARLWECNPACFEAIYGGDLEQVAAQARRFLKTQSAHAEDLRAALAPLVQHPAVEFGGEPAGRQALLQALYVAHRPLKRLEFYRGLLSALRPARSRTGDTSASPPLRAPGGAAARCPLRAPTN
jgi:glycosyltransferase involved in cell wall biosynthesis